MKITFTVSDKNVDNFNKARTLFNPSWFEKMKEEPYPHGVVDFIFEDASQDLMDALPQIHQMIRGWIVKITIE